jgi:putative transcriptional regulator
MIRNGEADPEKIRFYIGYSGWAGGQLDGELKEKSWLTADANRKLVFHEEVKEIWKDAIRLLGGEYEMMINFPIDPQLN